MAEGGLQEESAEAIRFGLWLSRWRITDLWGRRRWHRWSLSPGDIDDIATERQAATPTEHDILATTLKEHLQDRGEDHPVRYWRDLTAAHR